MPGAWFRVAGMFAAEIGMCADSSGRIYEGGGLWTLAHRRSIARQSFELRRSRSPPQLMAFFGLVPESAQWRHDRPSSPTLADRRARRDLAEAAWTYGTPLRSVWP